MVVHSSGVRSFAMMWCCVHTLCVYVTHTHHTHTHTHIHVSAHGMPSRCGLLRCVNGVNCTPHPPEVESCHTNVVVVVENK